MKRLVFYTLLLITSISSRAYDFEVNGIYYNFDGDNVSVTNGNSYYNGEIIVPSQVTYNTKTYKVTSLGQRAFYGCRGLTSITIPNSITSIEESAFSYCTGLTSISFPNSITSIEESAFYGCIGLTSITIPNSVTSIKSSAFWWCNGLTSIIVNKGNTKYDSRSNSNAIIETSSNTLIVGCKNTIIPNSVTSIGSYAFAGCTDLKTITIPNSVTSIGALAFSACQNLLSIAIPDNVTIIGMYAFSSCKSLTIVTIPNSVTHINNYSFERCNSLISVISKIEKPFNINEDVFNGISSNATLTVPKGAKNKYEDSSGWTKHFKTVEEGNIFILSVLANGNGSVTYDGFAVKNDTKVFTLNEGYSATITFTPDNGYRIKNVKVNDVDVTSSVSNNQYTVRNIKANTTVEVQFEAIPITTYALTIKATGSGSATYSGTTAKNNTKSFTLNEGTSATITFTPDIGYRIKSVKVNNVDVTSSVSKNQYTVSNIKANTTVEVEFEAIPIPTYTLTIKSTGNGSATYNGTTAKNNTKTFTLNEGTSATITFSPDEGYLIKSLKINSTDVTTQVSNNQYTISSISSNTTLEVEFDLSSGEKEDNIQFADAEVKRICVENWDTNGDGELSKTEAASVTSLNNKFYSNIIIKSFDELEYFTGLTIIGVSEFKRCSNLTSIAIPSGIIRIREDAFMDCNNLKAVFISDLGAWCNISFEEGMYAVETSNPLHYAHHLFLNGVEIRDLLIPNSITTIKYAAFEGCNGLTSVTIPNGVTSIDGVAFARCSGMTSITIPNSVMSIGSYAFNACSGLSSITIPSSVTSIGGQAFSYCGGLTSIVVESGNTRYDSRDNCNALIETSSNKLIYGCKNTIIPNSVTSIGESAFSGCSDLTSITIPNSVTSIGGYAFCWCSGLTSIVSEIINPFVIEDGVFYDNNIDIYAAATLIVPVGTKSLYQSTAGWNKFQNIVEAGEEPDLPGQIHINDIYYKVTESGEAEVVSVEEGEKSVIIPSTISHNNKNYKVTSIAKEVFENREHLAAVIWEPEAQFNATVNNPNFLLYVSDEKYASHTVKNVVVNGVAERLELADAANGNDFYCPRAFSAKNISYSHNYQMETGFGDSKGWETIVLPFDVQNYTHATKGEIEPFTTWTMNSNKKPFWLFELTASGYKDVTGIKANIPYIISMPNNRQYEQQYQIPGIVTFSATNVEVKKSDDMKSVSYLGRTFVPNYTNQNNLDYLPLNVNSNYVTYFGADAGSKFIGGLRSVHPFEAYMTTTDGTRSIDVLDGMTTAIKDIYMIPDDTEVIRVYDTKGVLVKAIKANDDLRRGLAAGIYIVNGKKMFVK